jgi:RHS repeat-associated protein
LFILYEFSNQLGSVSIELDEQSNVVTYEEYYAYGGTAYQAVRSQTDVPKLYRYTGKERDEETGFYYHGARYYAPWLARWISCDPLSISDGVNLYEFAHSNPLRFIDTTGKSGDETKNVKPQMRATLNQVSYAEEVTFKLQHPTTNETIKGTIDFGVGPKNEFMNFTMFLEAKGEPNSSRTPAQQKYHPLFEQGIEVEITSTKSSRLGLQKGQKVFIKTGHNFTIIDSSNLAAFKQGASEVYQSQPGILHIDAKGNTRFEAFPDEAALSKHLATKPSKFGSVKGKGLIAIVLGVVALASTAAAAAEKPNLPQLPGKASGYSDIPPNTMNVSDQMQALIRTSDYLSDKVGAAPGSGPALYGMAGTGVYAIGNLMAQQKAYEAKVMAMLNNTDDLVQLSNGNYVLSLKTGRLYEATKNRSESLKLMGTTQRIGIETYMYGKNMIYKASNNQWFYWSGND